MDKPQEHIQNKELKLLKNELNNLLVPPTELQKLNLFTQLEKDMPVKETRSWLKLSVGLFTLVFICSTLFIILPEKKEIHITEDKTTRIDSLSPSINTTLKPKSTHNRTTEIKENKKTEAKTIKKPLKTKPHYPRPSITTIPETKNNTQLPKKDSTRSLANINTLLTASDTISSAKVIPSETENASTKIIEEPSNAFNLNNMQETKTRKIFK